MTDGEGRQWLGARWSARLGSRPGQQDLTAIVMALEADVVAPVRRSLAYFGLLVAATVCAVLLASLRQIQRLLDPIVRLKAGTARLAAGDFTAPVAVSSADELQDLAQAFNGMAFELQRQFAELHALSVGTLEALARAIDAKSPWTAGHSTRVTRMAVAIATAMDLPQKDRELIRRGGLLHDIGKIGIPALILDKAGPLTASERAIIEEHPSLGARILEPLPHCQELLPMVLQHHERLDGSGYPHGLRGDEISLHARVMAVADVYDAMTSDRPYRRGLPLSEAVAFIRDGAGTHFDAAVVSAFVRVLEPEAAQLQGGTLRLIKSA
jgi:putative nucleotidyltransferase with HDIG domain